MTFTNDWTSPANWEENTAPVSGATSVAQFNASFNTNIFFSDDVSLNALRFNAGASPFVITILGGSGEQLTLTGDGIVNSSGQMQTIINGSVLRFGGNATSADVALSNDVFLYYADNANAGTSVISNGGELTMTHSASAGQASISNAGSGTMRLLDTASLGSALISNDGVMEFNNRSSARNATIENGTGGVLDLSGVESILDVGALNGAGAIFLGDRTLTVGHLNTDMTIGGIIQDGGITGAIGGILTKTGTGTLTLTGANTHTFRTGVEGGTLAVSADANLGAASARLGIQDGTLRFNSGFASAREVTLSSTGTFDTNGNNVTLTGLIEGNDGVLVKTGTGTLTLTGANTYVGGTVVDRGVLAISSDANLGAASGGLTFTNRATLQTLAGVTSSRAIFFDGTGGTVDTNGFNSTFSGVLSGAGRFTKAGAGVLTLAGPNINSGTTFMQAGTLRAAGANVFSSSSRIEMTAGTTVDLGGFDQTIAMLGGLGGQVTLGSGTLTIANSNTGTTFGGVISGSGGLVLSGDILVRLEGANTYTGGTTINGASLQLQNAGNIVGDVVNNGSLVFDRAGLSTFSGAISGTGSLMQLGASSVLELRGANTYSGDTSITRSSSVSIVADNNLGAATSRLTLDTGTLLLDGSIDLSRPIRLNSGGGTIQTNGTDSTLRGTIVGTGALTKTGAGMLVLAGENTYTGVTTVSAGALQIGAGGNTGTLSGNVTNSGSVIFNRSDDSAYAGVISGTGTLTKRGAGALTLSGANTYAGATAISGGTMVVNGSIASATAVSAGATLSGTGTINGAVSVAQGGTIATAGVGTLTVNGNVTFAPDSRFLVNATPSAAGLLAVTGAGHTASLAGTVDVQAGTGAYARNTTHTILTAAGGVTGTFGGVTSNLAFLTPSLAYDANSVRLTLTRNSVDFVDVAQTGNQRAVGAYLTALEASGARGQRLIPAFQDLSADQARPALESVGGDVYSSLDRVARATGVTTSLSGTLMPRLDASASSLDAGSAAEQGGGAWARALGGRGDLDGDLNATGLDWNSTGVAIGTDGGVGSNAALGVSLGFARSDVDFGAGRGTSEVTTPQFALYGSAHMGAFQLYGAAGVADHKYETERRIGVGSSTLLSSSRHEASERSAHVQLDYTARAGSFQLRPLVGLRYTELEEDAFAETGSTASLAVDARTSEFITSNLGMRATLPLNSDRATLELKAIWSHELGDTETTLTGRLTSDPGSGRFTVSGVPFEEDAALVGLGVTGELKANLFVQAAWDGELRSGQTQHAFTGGVRYVW